MTKSQQKVNNNQERAHRRHVMSLLVLKRVGRQRGRSTVIYSASPGRIQAGDRLTLQTCLLLRTKHLGSRSLKPDRNHLGRRSFPARATTVPTMRRGVYGGEHLKLSVASPAVSALTMVGREACL